MTPSTRLILSMTLGFSLLAACAEEQSGQPDQPADRAALRTVQQAMTPVQDSNLYATPAGSSPLGNNGGPTDTCELEVLREQFWSTTPPDMTGTGLTLDSMDPTRDGLYSSSLMIRCGPFVNQTNNPDCEGSVTISSGVTVVGVVGDNSQSEITTTDSSWGLGGVDYTSSSPHMESGEYISTTVNGDGSTTIQFTCSLNQTPYTDTMRILIDYGDTFREASAQIELTDGADINVGGVDGGGVTSTDVVLTSGFCGNSLPETGESCDDGNNTAGDGCDASCQTEPGYTCPIAGGQCLTVDLAEPVDGSSHQAGNVPVSGTATANADVTVIFSDSNGVTVDTQTVTADPSGDWTSADPLLLPEGDYTVTASVTTTGGTVDDSASITIDDTAPAVSITDPSDGDTLGDNTPTISGTSEADASITVEIRNTLGVLVDTFTTTASPTGDWSGTAGVTLLDGDYTVSATATDEAGNTSAPDTVAITIDTVAPTVVLIAPADGSSTNDNTPTISGTTTDPNATLTVLIKDDQGNTVETLAPTPSVLGDWSIDASQLADGDYTVEVSAEDAGGNINSDGPNAFSVDTTTPTIAITTPADGSATNDTTPQISGTVDEPGANVTITIQNDQGLTIQTLNTTADGAGDWSVDAMVLLDGDYTVEASAQDAAGNTSNTASNTFTVDTIAPNVTFDTPADGSSTGDNTPALSGTTNDNSATVTVVIRDGNGATVQTLTPPVDGAGNWTIDAAALPDGDYSATATATDAAGNSSDATNGFTVDTGNPTVAITAPADGSTSNDTTPTVSGTVSEPATVTVLIQDDQGNTVETITPAVNGSGDWSFDAQALADGTYTVSASAQDAAGNSSNTATSTFTVDTGNPTVTLTAPADGSATSDNTPAVSGSVTEPSATVTVEIKDANGATVQTVTPTVNGNGDWSFDASQLADGDYTVSASATDGGGNTSPTVTNAFSVDTSTPDVTISTPAANAMLVDNTPTVSGQVTEAGATVTVLIKDDQGNTVETATPVVDGNGDWSFDASQLADGAYTIEASATDAAGNSGSDGPVSFTVDTSAPIIAITTPGDGDATSDNTPTVSGTSDDTSAIVTVEIQDAQGNTVETITPAVDGNGDWSFDASQLADGAYTAVANAVDAAGNASNTASVNFSVDTTNPSLSITGPSDGSTTSDDTPTITGNTDEPGATVTVEIKDANGATVQTLTPTVGAGGSWSVDAAQLADGDYTLEATAIDAAGNSSPVATSGFTVDTSAPSVAILTPASGTSTNDDTPTVSGTAQVGSTVSVTISDDQGNVLETVSPTVDVMGNWSFDASQLSDGAYTVEATATDVVNNSASTSSGFEVDTSTPIVTLDAPVSGTSTNDDTPTISGTTNEPGAAVTVDITDDQGNIVETLAPMVDAMGNWSIDASQLPEGEYTASATATDTAGNSSAPVESTFTIDLTAPTLSITSPAMGELVETRDIEVTGQTEPGLEVTIEVIDDSGAVIDTITTTADMNGDYSGMVTDLANGDYTLRASTTDDAGNTASEEVGVTVDSEDLTLAIDEPVDGQETSDTTPTVSGSVDPDATVTVTILDEQGNPLETFMATVDMMGNFTGEPTTELDEGTYTVEVTSERPSGKSVTEQVSVTIDTTAPVVTLTSPADGEVTGETAPTITGTAEPGATVIIVIRDEAGEEVETLTAQADQDGNYSANATALDEGTYTIDATATDAAGNASTAGPNTVTIDTMAPPVTIDSPSQGEEVEDTTPTISGTGEPGATIEIFIDDEKVGEATVGEDGTWTYEVTDELDAGDHTIEATTTDEAGNMGSTGQIDFTIGGMGDGEGPEVTSPTPGDTVTGPSVTVTGTGNAGDTITVTIGDDTKTVTVGEDGTWEVTFEDVPDGDQTIVAQDGEGDTTEIPITVTAGDEEDEVTLLLRGGCSSAPGDTPEAPVELLLLGVGLIALRRKRAC